MEPRPGLPHFIGSAAQVFQVELPAPEKLLAPEHAATLMQWLVLAPGQHPFWPHYMLSTVHLRDIPGQRKPPTLRFANASHELMLVALNPAYKPWTPERMVMIQAGTIHVESPDFPGHPASTFLTPLNYSEQFAGLTDAQAMELCALIARALADGLLMCETSDFVNGRAIWEQVLANTVEHIKHGGHPSSN